MSYSPNSREYKKYKKTCNTIIDIKENYEIIGQLGLSQVTQSVSQLNMEGSFQHVLGCPFLAKFLTASSKSISSHSASLA
jgi:hypothetical protein